MVPVSSASCRADARKARRRHRKSLERVVDMGVEPQRDDNRIGAEETAEQILLEGAGIVEGAERAGGAARRQREHRDPGKDQRKAPAQSGKPAETQSGQIPVRYGHVSTSPDRPPPGGITQYFGQGLPARRRIAQEMTPALRTLLWRDHGAMQSRHTR